MTRLEAGWCDMEEYQYRVKAKQEREQGEWERARWQCFMLMRMHPYMKQKPDSPTAWVRFPWEQEKRKDSLDWTTSAEEEEKLREIIKDYREKRNGKHR